MEICTAPYVQANPAVVYNEGRFIAVWSDARYLPGYYWLVASCVDTTGAVLDTGYCVGTQVAQSEHYPDIAYDGNRSFVVWYTYHEPFGVYGRFINNNGQPDDTIITLSPTQAGYNVNPRIVFAAGRYFTVWADQRPGYSDLDIYGRFVSTSGQLMGDQILITTGASNQMYPAVAHCNDRLLVIWRDATMAIFGQWVDPGGILVGPNFCISDSTPYYRFRCAVDASANNCLVAWSEVHDNERDIFGNVDVVTHVEETPQSLEPIMQGATILRGPPRNFQRRRYTLYDVCGREITGMPEASGIYYIEEEGRILQKLILIE